MVLSQTLEGTWTGAGFQRSDNLVGELGARCRSSVDLQVIDRMSVYALDGAGGSAQRAISARALAKEQFLLGTVHTNKEHIGVSQDLDPVIQKVAPDDAVIHDDPKALCHTGAHRTVKRAEQLRRLVLMLDGESNITRAAQIALNGHVKAVRDPFPHELVDAHEDERQMCQQCS